MATTQQIFNTDEVYISMYDNPKKKQKGRPKGSSLTDEEKAIKKRDNSKRWYEQNCEYVLLKKKIIREVKNNAD